MGVAGRLGYFPLFTYLFLGICLYQTHGEYHPWYLAGLVSTLAVTVGQLYCERDFTPSEFALWAAGALGFWLLKYHLVLYHREDSQALSQLYLLLHYSFWLYLWSGPFLFKRHRATPLLLGASALLLLASLALVPKASPAPAIDVFTVGTQGADLLAQGQNPYQATYQDIYQGRYSYKPGYLYWPGTLILQTPSRLLLGDIRYLSILCQVSAAVSLWLLTPGAAPRKWLTTLLWLSFPVSFVMLEKAWIDILVVGLFPLFLIAARTRHTALSGLCLGLICSIKQYNALLALLAIPWLWRTFGSRKFALGVTWAVATWAAIVLPFVAWDPQVFYRETLQAVSLLPMRADAMTVQAWLLAEWNIVCPQALPNALYLVALGVLFYLCRATPTEDRYLWAVTTMFTIVFLLGKQAFLNYYFWLAYLLVIQLSKGPAQAQEE